MLAGELETGTFRYSWTQGFGRRRWTLAKLVPLAVVVAAAGGAVVATLAAYAGLAFAVGGFLREHYLAPVVTTKLNVPGSAWILSQWGTKGGALAWTGEVPPRSSFAPTAFPARASRRWNRPCSACRRLRGRELACR